jgi:choice-of-anchor B domain-containing protein
MRRRQGPLAGALAALVVSLVLGGCGSGSTDPTPLASASPSPAAGTNMTLLAQLDLGTLTTNVHAHHDEPLEITGAVSAAGNWGYTTAGGRRFALTGTSAGTSIVEVTDPARPRPVALIPGPASQWREIRTYGEYVYTTTEARHGLDIISMKDPDHPVKVRTWNRTFETAHSLWIDQERGLLFVNGSNGRGGNLRILDVGANPEDPEEVGVFGAFYVHDSYTRGTTLFASAIYDGFLSLIDVANPRRPVEITRFNTGGRFTHNSWLTRDGRYVFTTDERAGRPLEGWDITDVMAPRKVAEYIAAPNTTRRGSSCSTCATPSVPG